MNFATFGYRDASSLAIGLTDLRKKGLTPRGLLFLALDPRGVVHLAVPEDLDRGTSIRVGDKLALTPPWEGRVFHFDAIHRLPGGSVLWNGDRRLHTPGSHSEVAVSVAEWIKGFGARNVFLGCTPHQPGAWWVASDRAPVDALHEQGYADVVTVQGGLLARRIGDTRLFYQSFTSLAQKGAREGWTPVFASPLGNVLLLERRVNGDRLVITCERGLVEVSLAALPSIDETDRAETELGYGVVGRVDSGAFAVTLGKREPWGLSDVAPAVMMGARAETLRHLIKALAASKPFPGA